MIYKGGTEPPATNPEVNIGNLSFGTVFACTPAHLSKCYDICRRGYGKVRVSCIYIHICIWIYILVGLNKEKQMFAYIARYSFYKTLKYLPTACLCSHLITLLSSREIVLSIILCDMSVSAEGRDWEIWRLLLLTVAPFTNSVYL